MSLRFAYFTCTIMAMALLGTLGETSQAQQGLYYQPPAPGGCTEGCTGGSTADGCTGGALGGGCNGGACADSGSRHSWRHADCGGDCGHMCGRRCRNMIEGLDPHFNCECNGSYNFPVPPLYTYMWPGMYKHQLMSDYDNPWRFPPIKAYTDESADVLPEEFRKNYPHKAAPPVIHLDEQVESGRSRAIQPVSIQRELPRESYRSYTGVEPLSKKMERYYSSSPSLR